MTMVECYERLKEQKGEALRNFDASREELANELAKTGGDAVIS
jgi:hypothetical protein